MKVRNLIFVNFITILTVTFQNGFGDFLWINHLVKYIEDSKFSRLLLIIDDDNKTSKHIIDDVIQKLKFVPLNTVGLKKATLEHGKEMFQMTQFKDLQSTTLVITFLSVENKKFSKIFASAKFLISLHSHEPRTKCLTIVCSEVDQYRYNKFLQQMWLNDFLDFTIFEISKKEEKDGAYLISSRSENVKIHSSLHNLAKSKVNFKYLMKIRLDYNECNVPTPPSPRK